MIDQGASALHGQPSDTPSRPDSFSYSLSQFVLRQLPPIAVFRAALYLLERRRATTKGRWTVATLTGALYTGDSRGDLVQDMVQTCGFWDWKSLAIASLFCKPGDSVVEIGAHAGTETVAFASIVGPHGRVTAFEPGPALFAKLEQNVRLNNFKHVTIQRSAVGEHIGYATFVAADSRNSGSSFIREDETTDGEIVPVVTLDSEESKLGQAALLFIDVEGFEVKVLHGARSYLAKHRPIIVIEAYGAALQRAGTSVKSLAQELRGEGYEIFRVGRLGLSALNSEFRAPEVSENWLCLPRERQKEHRKVTRALRRYAFWPCAFGLHPIMRKAQRAASSV